MIGGLVAYLWAFARTTAGAGLVNTLFPGSPGQNVAAMKDFLLTGPGSYQRSGGDVRAVWNLNTASSVAPAAPTATPTSTPAVPSIGTLFVLETSQSIVSGIVSPAYSSWYVYDLAPPGSVDGVCDFASTYGQVTTKGGISTTKPEYPESMTSFTSNGITGCSYTGSLTSVGTMTCPGVDSITCVAGSGDVVNCLNFEHGDDLVELDKQISLYCEW